VPERPPKIQDVSTSCRLLRTDEYVQLHILRQGHRAEKWSAYSLVTPKHVPPSPRCAGLRPGSLTLGHSHRLEEQAGARPSRCLETKSLLCFGILYVPHSVPASFLRCRHCSRSTTFELRNHRRPPCRSKAGNPYGNLSATSSHDMASRPKRASSRGSSISNLTASFPVRGKPPFPSAGQPFPYMGHWCPIRGQQVPILILSYS
jgi:hypothetical protein